MKYYFSFIILLFYSGYAQVNFKMELKKADPIEIDSKLSNNEKFKIHQRFLQKAISEKNVKNEFYGHLFLYVDYYKVQDYVKLNESLLKAEKIAYKSNNLSWEAAIHMRKALVNDLKVNDEEELKEYKLALEKSKKAGDSLCVGESLEQISTVYKKRNNFKFANEYYLKALPILQKYADSQQMALTYNNYGNLLSYQGKNNEAKIYLDSAISIARKNKNLYKEMLYLNNKASLLTTTKEYDAAVKIFKTSAPINIENKWSDRLQQNYLGLSVLYEEKGDYKEAFTYLKEFYILKDSINGLEVNLKIADLETQYKTESKEISLKEARLKINNNELKLQRIYIILFFLFLAILFVTFKLIKKVKKSKQELISNKQKLEEVKELLIKKNELLLLTENELNKSTNSSEDIEDSESFDIYNLRILTESDWSAFKKYFNNIYPNYIKKLRDTFPKITESEERLFLCLKLNMKNKEVASVIGISNESVKKSRNRLRKKLNLNIDEDLEDFVNKF